MTSQIPEELLVRPARHQDYHAVLAISQNVYDGFDYLPYLYHILLQDKKTNTAYVGELNGEIVSLTKKTFTLSKPFLKFWRTSVLYMGPLIPLFWTSGDVSSGSPICQNFTSSLVLFIGGPRIPGFLVG